MDVGVERQDPLPGRVECLVDPGEPQTLPLQPFGARPAATSCRHGSRGANARTRRRVRLLNRRLRSASRRPRDHYAAIASVSRTRAQAGWLAGVVDVRYAVAFR